MLEAGIDDRGGLEKSLRVLPVDLRVPSGFQSVYRVPGEEERMMRGSGALFAIFPRSLYRRTSEGSTPIIPAGTVYSIGMPGGFTYPGGFLRDDVAPPDPRIATLVDRRVRLTPIADAPALRTALEHERASPVRLGIAGFVDAAPATRRFAGDDGQLHVDLGVGLRLKVPGSNGSLRVDLARGLRDGAVAFSAGWVVVR